MTTERDIQRFMADENAVLTPDSCGDWVPIEDHRAALLREREEHESSVARLHGTIEYFRKNEGDLKARIKELDHKLRYSREETKQAQAGYSALTEKIEAMERDIKPLLKWVDSSDPPWIQGPATRLDALLSVEGDREPDDALIDTKDHSPPPVFTERECPEPKKAPDQCIGCGKFLPAIQPGKDNWNQCPDCDTREAWWTP